MSRREFCNWILIRDPGCVPDRKGPFRHDQLKDFLIEVFEARPLSFVEVITLYEGGQMSVQDGPEALEVIDGRYRFVARKHRGRLHRHEYALKLARQYGIHSKNYDAFISYAIGEWVDGGMKGDLAKDPKVAKTLAVFGKV